MNEEERAHHNAEQHELKRRVSNATDDAIAMLRMLNQVSRCGSRIGGGVTATALLERVFAAVVRVEDRVLTLEAHREAALYVRPRALGSGAQPAALEPGGGLGLARRARDSREAAQRPTVQDDVARGGRDQTASGVVATARGPASVAVVETEEETKRSKQRALRACNGG